MKKNDEIPYGFWRYIASDFIELNRTKPFFGKPYLKLGQCIELWSQLFEIGGILGSKHPNKVGALVSCFLGMSGASGIAEKVLGDISEKLQPTSSLVSMKIYDYIMKATAKKMNYSEGGNFLIENGNLKIIEEANLTMGWNFASSGLSLGVYYPEVFRKMFDCTYATVNKEEWSFANKSGLAIPSEQPTHEYLEQELLWNEAFLEFSAKNNQGIYFASLSNP